jgi:hypothetical protein
MAKQHRKQATGRTQTAPPAAALSGAEGDPYDRDFSPEVRENCGIDLDEENHLAAMPAFDSDAPAKFDLSKLLMLVRVRVRNVRQVWQLYEAQHLGFLFSAKSSLGYCWDEDWGRFIAAPATKRRADELIDAAWNRAELVAVVFRAAGLMIEMPSPVGFARWVSAAVTRAHTDEPARMRDHARLAAEAIWCWWLQRASHDSPGPTDPAVDGPERSVRSRLAAFLTQPQPGEPTHPLVKGPKWAELEAAARQIRDGLTAGVPPQDPAIDSPAFQIVITARAELPASFERLMDPYFSGSRTRSGPRYFLDPPDPPPESPRTGWDRIHIDPATSVVTLDEWKSPPLTTGALRALTALLKEGTLPAHKDKPARKRSTIADFARREDCSEFTFRLWLNQLPSGLRKYVNSERSIGTWLQLPKNRIRATRKKADGGIKRASGNAKRRVPDGRRTRPATDGRATARSRRPPA